MKTLAIRLDDDLHAQLSVLAQLCETSLTDEIRQALEAHIQAKRANPDLTERAKLVADEIESEAKARQAAIATLFGSPGQSGSSTPAGSKRPRSSDDAPGNA